MRNVEEDLFNALRFLDDDPEGWLIHIRGLMHNHPGDYGITEDDLRKLVRNAHLRKAMDLLNELATGNESPHQTIWRLRGMIYDRQLVLTDLNLDNASLEELKIAAWRRAVPTLIKRLAREYLRNEKWVLLEDTLNWCDQAMRHGGVTIDELSPEDRERYDNIAPLVRSRSEAEAV